MNKILNVIEKIKMALKLISFKHPIRNIKKITREVIYNLFKSKTSTFTIITEIKDIEVTHINKYFNTIINNNYQLDKVEIILYGEISNQEIEREINEWIVEYPKIIKLIKDSDINKAVQVSQNNWITFIKFNDFIDFNYFKQIDKAIYVSKGQPLVCAKPITYNELNQTFINDNPFASKYKTFFSTIKRDLTKEQMSFERETKLAFFNRAILNQKKIEFTNQTTDFKEQTFIWQYLKQIDNYNITYVRSAKYYARKQNQINNDLDPSFYTRGLNYYLDLLVLSSDYKLEIKETIINAIIYDLIRNIKNLEWKQVDLINDQRIIREDYLSQIFKLIPFENIIKRKKQCSRNYQIGINKRYYSNLGEINNKIKYIQETKDYYKYLLIDSEDNWEFYLDNQKYQVSDLENRIQYTYINDQVFTNRRYIKIYKKYTDVRFEYLGVKQELPIVNFKYQDKEFNQDSIILLFDRENKADDNAEVFYEWMQAKHPEYERVYYVLSKDSIDWKRLDAKGYKLVDYGSKNFEKLYQQADFLLSSSLHASLISNYKQMRYNGKKRKAHSKFVFLQHGIILNDMSKWFGNRKIDQMVVTANPEYHNLVNKYTFFDDQIIHSGLPRYDKLYTNPQKEILLQLTWRKELQEMTTEEISKSDYIKKIKNILKDSGLLSKLKEYGYILKYIPHPEINPHISLFKENENEYIQAIDATKIIYRDQFARANLMITDYSSVFTDFCYLKKPVIYYQDDYTEFYKAHIYGPEVNYKSAGLGPVQENHQDLINKIIEYIDNDCQMEEKYIQRVNQFFKYNDQNNCQRLYDRLRADY